MKTIKQLRNSMLIAAMLLLLAPGLSHAQVAGSDVLDQNISISVEDEKLSDVVKRICDYLDLDYRYNSEILADKKVSLNVSNKPIKFVLDKLMKDYYLLFEIQDNILVVRDYVPLDKSMDYATLLAETPDNVVVGYDGLEITA